jgi:enterochelin esterase-like enzyme
VRGGHTLLLAFILVLPVACSSDPAEPENEGGGGIELPGWFFSSEVGDWLQIYVHLPEGFSPEDAPDTHLVLLLDADWYMDGSHPRLGSGGVAGMVERLAAFGTIPPVALVGIGQINRSGESTRGRDFVSSPDRFLKFISNELLPILHQEFAAADREFLDITLLGHSSAANFSLWALFQDAPALFRNVVAISAQLNGYPHDVIEMARAYYDRAPTEAVCLFLGVGGAEETRFLSSFSRMMDTLDSMTDSNLVIGSQLFQLHNHGSVVSPGFSAGLGFVFSPECYPTSAGSARPR